MTVHVSSSSVGLPDFVPWARPALVGREAELVQKALASSWISGGPFVEEFESRLKTLTGSAFVASCANGTGAIELAYMALGLKPGDGVVVPAFGYMAAANAAHRYGLDVRFADVDESTWCVTPDSIEQAVDERTRCVVPIHTYGAVADIAGIRSRCDKSGIYVLEDAAEAFGSSRGSISAGTLGSIGTLSFHATKTIATGEGGAVLSNDEGLADLVQLYRSHGTRSKKYLHLVPGMNYRLTNLQAAIGVAQLEMVGYLMTERVRIHQDYRRHLDDVPDLVFQHFESGTSPVVWATGIRLSDNFSEDERDQIIHILKEEYLVETRPGFYGPDRHPYFASSTWAPVSTRLSSNLIVLPCFVAMTDEQIERSTNSLKRAVDRIRNDRK